jgi:predicted transcriptional regulator of viral defense system
VPETISVSILRRLSKEGRRVLSDWRALILWRRATLDLDRVERRWKDLPSGLEEVYPVLRRMEERGEIRAIPRLRHLYAVTVPYAPTGHVEEDEILMEANPYAALSHITAMVFHGLTDELPQRLIASIPERGTAGLLPPGTDSLDWEGLYPPVGTTPKSIRHIPVHWVHLTRKKYFGTREYRPRTYPVRVTTPERTLLDCLQQPDLCGGFENVLQAWTRTIDTIDIDEILNYTELYGINLLRQRVGFILEELGIQHPTLEEWRQQAKRGGSSKLVSSLPYTSTHSERWNLSLNAPVNTLREAVL